MDASIAIARKLYKNYNTPLSATSKAKVLRLEDITGSGSIALAPIGAILTLPTVNGNVIYPVYALLGEDTINFAHTTTTYRLIDGLAAIALLYNEGWVATIPATNTAPFIGVDELILHLQPSKECVGNAENIVPFYTKIIEANKLTHVCMYTRKLKHTLRPYIRIKIRQNTVISMEIPENFQEDIAACKERIILVEIALLYSSSSGHSNILIIDKELREYERFEPNGYMPEDAIINSALSTILIGYKYIAPLDYCPYDGPQQEEQDTDCPEDSGFCVVWTTLYGHLRMLNPSKNRQEIISKLLTIAKIPNYLKRYLTYVNSVVSNG